MPQEINKPRQPTYASPYDPQMSTDGIVKFYRGAADETVENGNETLPTIAGIVAAAEAQLPPFVAPPTPGPGEKPVFIWDEALGKYTGRELTMDDIKEGFSVSLTAATALVEVGSTLVTPAFTATYARTPATAVLTDNQGTAPKNVIDTPASFSSSGSFTKNSYGATASFTISAADAGGTVRASVATIAWGQRVYWGVGVPGQSSESFIESLGNSALALSRARTFNVNAGSGQKAYYAHDAADGIATFTMGGFEGGFLPPVTVAVSNASGITRSYFLYESFTAGLGASSFTAS